MDFDTYYTKEQEAFRTEVCAWLDENAPVGLNIPADGAALDQETQHILKAFRRKLGRKGWLAPSWPVEIGGAGLDPDIAVVIREELGHLRLPPVGDNRRWINAVLVWGTEEQKRRYILPALRGEVISWQAFGEAGGGADIAGIKTRAVAEGDQFVVSGIKAFITGPMDPDYLLTLAVTAPERPLRRNLGILMIDAGLPGITIHAPKLLVGSERTIYLNDVHVPADCLIGGIYMGWEIAQTILQQERGEMAFRPDDRQLITSVLEYLREERRSQGTG